MARTATVSSTTETTTKPASGIASFINKVKALEVWRMATFTPVLVVLLLIAAYLIGSLQTEVRYLRQNPEQRAAAVTPTTPQQPDEAPPRPTPNLSAVPKVSNDDHKAGAANPQAYLVTYTDYECPFCKSFHPTVKQVLQEYGDRVAVIYRHLPLPFHANAQKQAEAAECIAELGGDQKFWEYTDKIFERTTSNGTGFALDKLGPLAAELGVNQSQFQSCLDSGKYAQRVQDQMNAAQTAGATGTPSSFTVTDGGEAVQIIVGAQPFAQVKLALDNALQK